MGTNPIYMIDFYKADHRRQYPEGTTEIYSNMTARGARYNHSLMPDFGDFIVVFGIQHFIEDYLISRWNEFFQSEKEPMLNEYKAEMCEAFCVNDFDVSHLSALHDLGYLPIKIKAIPEGVKVPLGVPFLTVVNTHPDFFWLTNYIETALSAYLWKPITCATNAYVFKRMLKEFQSETSTFNGYLDYQAHDFSFRGMSCVEDAAICGAAHLTAFKGTDCLPAILLLGHTYYASDFIAPVGNSVPATEHSVMCAGGRDGELETIRRLLVDVYPEGIVSIVADTYNLWTFITTYLEHLYPIIIQRPGTLVIRPDSGNPFDIILGDKSAPEKSAPYTGALELLWQLFGGTINDKGFKVLNNKVRLIYGDAITFELAQDILTEMKRRGFSAENIVFGIGSYTYQYISRDTLGFAIKATSAVINGKRQSLIKDPITSSGLKRSAKGLLRVDFSEQEGKFVLTQDVSKEEEEKGELLTMFENGSHRTAYSLHEIRTAIDAQIENDLSNK